MVAPASLVDKLWVLRDEFRRRHPDTKFDGALVAVISREAPYAEIVSVLRAMHEAGFPHPQFAFTRRETYARPMLRGFDAGGGGSGQLKRLRRRRRRDAPRRVARPAGDVHEAIRSRHRAR